MLKKTTITITFLLLFILIPCHTQGYDRKTDSLVKKIVAVVPVRNEFNDEIVRGFKDTCEFFEVETIEAFTKDNFRQKDNLLADIRKLAPDLILAVGDNVLLLLKDHFDDIPIIYVYGSEISDRIAKEKDNIINPRGYLNP